MMPGSPRFSLSDMKKTQPVAGWQGFWDDGKAFLKTASAAHEKSKKPFTPEILYNIIAMAIEKFVMAALMRHGKMPYNHTMGDLVVAMEEAFPEVMGELKEDLLRLDRYQEICDIDAFKITPPLIEEIPHMLKLAESLEKLVSVKLLNESAN